VVTSLTKVTTGKPLQLSLAVTLPVLGAGTCAAHWKVRLAGQVMDGGVPSKTVMVWVHVAVIKHASVALYVRVIVKRLAHVMFEITSGRLAMVTVPPQLSELVTLDVLADGTWLAQDTVIAAGQVMEGGVRSLTVIVCVQVVELLHSSVAR
jgi:hypothetical protein